MIKPDDVFSDSEPPIRSGITSGQLSVVIAEPIRFTVRQTPSFAIGDSACLGDFTWAVQQNGNGDDIQWQCNRIWVGTIQVSNIFAAKCKPVQRTAADGTQRFMYNFNWAVSELTETGVVRQLNYSLPFEISFKDTAAVQVGQVQAFSQIVMVAAVASQQISLSGTLTPSGTLRFRTSVQAPFQLTAFSLGPAPTSANNAPTPVAGTDFPTSVTVTPTPSAVETISGCASTAGSVPCEQEWSASLTAGSDICFFSGPYRFWFTVVCNQGTPAGDCPLDPVNQFSATVASFTVQLATSDHCPDIVDTLVPVGTVTTFENVEFTVQKDDFLEGQRVYFRVSMQAAQATLSGVRVKELRISPVSGQSIDLITTDQSGAVSIPNNNFALLTHNGNILLKDYRACDQPGLGASAKCYWDFSLLALSSELGVPNDQSRTITVSGTAVVSYRDAGVQSASERLQEKEVPLSVERLNGQSASFSSRTTRMRGRSTRTGSASPAAAESGFLGSSSGLAAVGGGFAFIVGAIVAAIVVVRRRRQRASQLEPSGSTVELKAASDV